MTSYMRYWYEFEFIIKGLYPLCFYDLEFTFRLWFSTMLLLCFCLRRLWCVLKKMKHTPFIFFKTRTIKNLQFHLFTFDGIISTLYLAFQVLILEFFLTVELVVPELFSKLWFCMKTLLAPVFWKTIYSIAKVMESSQTLLVF
jgi:hypothetical protein